jgi:DNA polymerase-3 subunit delta'
MVFPWQIKQWQQIWRAKQENRLAHALLVAGVGGTGKAQFVESFVRAYCCKHSKTTASDCVPTDECSCHACRLIKGRAHPNVLWIEPEKIGSAIKVDQIRDISDFINQTSLQEEYRIVIVNPADEMNINAANALLKTLEEPSPGSILILISNHPAQLPATILSRCQRIIFPRPDKALALTWLNKQLSSHNKKSEIKHDGELLLRLAHGAPLAAMQLVKNEILSARTHLFQTLYSLSQKQTDPIQAAAKIQDLEPIAFLDFMLTWIMDLLKLHLGCAKDEIINQDFAPQLITLQHQGFLNATKNYMNYLQHIRGQIQMGINLNKQLMIENVLIRWRNHVFS